MLLALVEALAVVALRGSWGRLFSSDPLIVDMVAKVLPLVAAFILADSLACSSLAAILRAAGGSVEKEERGG